jgi:transcription-repair coupling factor (superfamily II helicase)
MPTQVLEDVVGDFYEGKYDVLLATTIVEAGLDIPRANTLIVHRADMFGLAQLYQLRGRVGRAKVRAYAYLTTPDADLITESAEKRLRVLRSLDSLGAGFQIASHDLDMRGGGNLLGEEQSGQIREVGVELYQSMLEEAVAALREGGADVQDDWSPQINIGATVLIPESYVEDLNLRLSLYRRLGDITEEQEREAFAAEIIDRFGPMPDEVRQLLDVAAIRSTCKMLGIARIDAGPKGGVFSFRDNARIDPAKLVEFVSRRAGTLRLRPDFKLAATQEWSEVRVRGRGVRAILKELNDLAA